MSAALQREEHPVGFLCRRHQGWRRFVEIAHFPRRYRHRSSNSNEEITGQIKPITHASPSSTEESLDCRNSDTDVLPHYR